MIGDRIIEVSKFKLFYDGFFKVRFEYNDKNHDVRPYLTPEMLLKIIHNEEFEVPFQSLDFYSKGVSFSKTTLLFEVFDNDDNKIGFLTSEETDHHQELGFYFIYCEIKS